MPSKLIHNCTRLGFLEHQGQDERLVSPVASSAGGAGAGGGGGAGHQLCLKPCCHDLNTRFSLNNINDTKPKQISSPSQYDPPLQAFWVSCLILLGSKLAGGCTLSLLPSWIHKASSLWVILAGNKSNKSKKKIRRRDGLIIERKKLPLR